MAFPTAHVKTDGFCNLTLIYGRISCNASDS